MPLFDATSLQKHIDATLATIPPGHHAALVGYWTMGKTGMEWRMEYAQRFGDIWQIGGTFGQDQANGIYGGVTVKASW